MVHQELDSVALPETDFSGVLLILWFVGKRSPGGGFGLPKQTSQDHEEAAR